MIYETIPTEETPPVGVDRYFVSEALRRSELPPTAARDKSKPLCLVTFKKPVTKASLVMSTRNIRMMHLLENIAAHFNRAGVPLMVLKGAALHLTLYTRPDERPMDDLDLLIKPEHLDQACALLERLGAVAGKPLVRDDFFPRFYYEKEYTLGQVYPIKIDLHVRPFRPLRYSQLVPPDAFWRHAVKVNMGGAHVLVPCAEEMLIHLAAHAATHGSRRATWRRDIKLWFETRRKTFDWQSFLRQVSQWRLSLPVRRGLEEAGVDLAATPPLTDLCRLSEKNTTWRDRLVLRQAPRDAARPVGHVLVNLIGTPGRRFVLAYLLAVLLPDRTHMGQWYRRRHWGWLSAAHVLRWMWPILKHLQPLWPGLSKAEARVSGVDGIGVFATRAIEPSQVIARCEGKPVEHDGPHVAWSQDASGHAQRYEIAGPLKSLKHSCRPNAELSGLELVALQPVDVGHEITIDYRENPCPYQEQRKGVHTGGPPYRAG